MRGDLVFIELNRVRMAGGISQIKALRQQLFADFPSRPISSQS